MQREKLAGRYKTKTVMYEALMFLQIWYFASTTIFQIIQKKEFLTDCRTFFDAIATFTQTIAGLIIQIGKEAAQISNGLSNLVIAGVVYWIIRILICGGCLAVVGIFLAFIGICISNCQSRTRKRQKKYRKHKMRKEMPEPDQNRFWHFYYFPI